MALTREEAARMLNALRREQEEAPSFAVALVASELTRQAVARWLVGNDDAQANADALALVQTFAANPNAKISVVVTPIRFISAPDVVAADALAAIKTALSGIGYTENVHYTVGWNRVVQLNAAAATVPDVVAEYETTIEEEITG